MSMSMHGHVVNSTRASRSMPYRGMHLAMMPRFGADEHPKLGRARVAARPASDGAPLESIDKNEVTHITRTTTCRATEMEGDVLLVAADRGQVKDLYGVRR